MIIITARGTVQIAGSDLSNADNNRRVIILIFVKVSGKRSKMPFCGDSCYYIPLSASAFKIEKVKMNKSTVKNAFKEYGKL
ncbi:CLUMA_CG013668, isoform A [Clunio marinus]|uniref:CLUMA_CG013668, isoform A n=1 Tax=Clunio marinus TaxID=568069 RepID=A0A1J1IPI0_9DIPT|nr:CLUMA_CG013668, isoform A [Clunio marinus]